ncbi:Phosphopantetheine attachment site [Clostridium cavendishii DSM 21758]|uniref:Phosphopantetheine attachment site n=1 Tax=Clostridium cavendishii DSM 21758 TaxID=1121302 RepID=A0A1M6MT60_9CLOT|nr:type I polyketide synthase [Clostridium cavendishii]SHJ86463.1 Phosphopantetheine attachment site [Clostridium cavendishii DSM 21758]
MDIYEYIISQTVNKKIDQSVANHLLKYQMQNEKSINKDIAIIGMALNFPNCDTIDEFWNNICSKTNNITVFPENRKRDANAFFRMTGSKFVNEFSKGAYLNRIDEFDYNYFGISPLEANLMDLNQRLFLQVAVQAMEDAGYGTKKLADTNTGVYIGYSDDFCQEYKTLVATAQPELYNLSISGNVHSIIASRIAYILNLKGPAMLVDTACSSALTAVHLAVQGLLNGDCETAIVGGAKLSLVPSSSLLPIASSDGRCRAFDDESDGTGFGEGVAAVLLKPLDKAIKDKDSIYAVIKGSAVNQDGASIGITAPNSLAQASLLEKAWKGACVEPETISYIETHGTGTKLGDPVEIDGITKAFSKFTNKKQFCAISSAKSGVGHLDHLAGMASLCKAVIALNLKQIPPTLHFRKPNRNITFENSPVYVNDKVTPWKQGETPRRCGVSSFGISGTNCHVVLEEYIEEVQEQQDDNKLRIFMLSSQTRDGLMSTIKNNLVFLRNHKQISLTNLCFTAQCYRDHHPCRIVFLVNSIEELIEKLSRVIKYDKLISMTNEGIFFGYSKVIPIKKEKQEDEIYEHEVKNYTNRSKELLNKDQSLESMEELCSLYVKLADIDWSVMHKKEYTKVHYPGYSFSPERCWVSMEEKNKVEDYGIVKCVAKTNGQRIYTTTLSPTESWELTEHRFYGQALLPGTAYVEILKKVADDFGDVQAVELSELIFLSPLIFKIDEPREVMVVLKIEDDFIKFRIESEEKLEEETSNWLVHAEGEMEYIYEEAPTVDLVKLKETYFNGNEKEFEFDSNEDGPISFGLRWDNVDRYSVIDNRVLAYFKLKDFYRNDCIEHIIHPALLDNAVNIAIKSIEDGLYLPWTYKKICIYDNLPSEFYSFLILKGNDVNNEFVKFDAQLIDKNGKVLIEINDYAIKKVNSIGVEGTTEPMPEVFSIDWEKEERKSNEKSDNSKDDIVLFYMSDNVPYTLKQEFEENGHVVMLEKMKNRDFSGLLSKLSREKSIKFVFYACELYDDFESLDKFKEVFDETLYSFLEFVQDLLKGAWKNPNIEIILIAREVYEITGEEKILQPHYSSFLALGKVVTQEYSNIKCTALDIDVNFDMKELYQEIIGQKTSYYIGLRQNQRYKMQLQERKTSSLIERNLNLRKDGVYIITGGTGGLGLEIAKHIASQQTVHFIFAQRSKLPDRNEWGNSEERTTKEKRAIEAIEYIEKIGSTVALYSIDVTCGDQVKELVEEVRNQFGTITGVIHAAGQPGNGFILNKDISEFEKVMNPKVLGTWLLDNETKQDNLDFFILFSSITSLLGGMGQSDYTAANSFLDAFAYLRNRRSGNTIVINWGPWKETGMAVDYKVKDDQQLKQISTNGALQVFDLILSKKISQLVVGNLNTKTSMIHEYYLPLSKAISNRYKRQKRVVKDQQDIHVKDKIENINPEDVLELVSSIWEEVLQIKDIDIYKNFTLLGGDSIIAAYLVKKMEERFGNIIDITDIFAYPSVFEMASHIKEIVTSEENQCEEKDSISLMENTESDQLIDEAYLDNLVSKLVEEKGNLESSFKVLSEESSELWIK